MYTAREYIVVNRVAHFIKLCIDKQMSFVSKSSVSGDKTVTLKYHDVNDMLTKEQWIKTRLGVEALFQNLFPGANIKDFVRIEAHDPENLKTLYILLVEIFEPQYIYVPIVITADDILMVSPFGSNVLEEHLGNKHIFPLVKTWMMYEESETSVHEFLGETSEDDNSNWKQNATSFREAILAFADITNDFYQVLEEEIPGMDAETIIESTKNDALFNYAKERVNMEALIRCVDPGEDAEYDNLSTALREMDTAYLPISIKIGEDNESFLSLKVDNNKLQILDTRFKSSSNDLKCSVIYVPRSEDMHSYLINITGLIYIGNNKVCYNPRYVETATDEETDLFEYVITGEERRLADVSTEGFFGTLKDVTSAIKIFGIRKGSSLYGAIMAITKLPRGLAKAAWNTLKHSFKVRVELEKDQSLDFQEKVLNDELDIVREKAKHYAEAGIRAAAWTAVFGNLFLLPIFYIMKLNSNRKIKLRGIERLEFKLDGMIEEVETKLDQAKQESDYKGVNALLREKHNLEFSRLKLIEFKKELTKTDRIRYMTFNKDNSMNSRQRIDALMSGGGYYNIGVSDGKGFKIGTSLSGEDF